MVNLSVKMIWISSLLVCGILNHLLGTVHASYNYTNANALEDYLLTNYHTMVRPYDTTNISVDFGIYQITALNTVDQTLSLVGFQIMMWDDDRLTWTPTDYDGMTSTYLRDDQIWVPPLALANSAEDIDILSDDTDTKSIPLAVQSTGHVIWLAAANYLVACTVDITYYPFDQQVCELQVSAWMYKANEVYLETTSPFINLELYEENGEWDITNTETDAGSRTMHGHSMSQVIFKLYMARKNSYYILNLILPVVFISFLGCLVFVLPVESGEKNGFALTILLSLTVVLTIVSDKIPTTSINLCILSVYLLCTIMVSVFEVLVTVIIQRIHIKTSHKHKPGDRTQGLIRCLATLTFYKTNKTGEGDPNDDLVQNVVRSSLSNTRSSAKGRNKVSPTAEKVSTTNLIFLKESLEYEDLANILDRLCLVTFFFMTLLITLTFQLILSNGE